MALGDRMKLMRYFKRQHPWERFNFSQEIRINRYGLADAVHGRQDFELLRHQPVWEAIAAKIDDEYKINLHFIQVLQMSSKLRFVSSKK